MVETMTLNELDNVRSTLLNGVSRIHDQLPGYLFAHGSNAVPLILGSGPRAGAAAGVYFGQGKFCAFGHNGYAYVLADHLSDTLFGNTSVLLKNCASWATNNAQNVTYMLHGVDKKGAKSFYNSIPGFSLNETSYNAFDGDKRTLEYVDLLIINLNSVDSATSQSVSMLDTFLRRGGGMIIVSTAWAHSITIPEKFPGNVFLAHAGVSWYTYYFTSPPMVSSISTPISELNP